MNAAFYIVEWEPFQLKVVMTLSFVGKWQSLYYPPVHELAMLECYFVTHCQMIACPVV